jgi:hypothetical protein
VGAMVLIVLTLTQKEFTAIGIALAALIVVYGGLVFLRRRAA